MFLIVYIDYTKLYQSIGFIMMFYYLCIWLVVVNLTYFKLAVFINHNIRQAIIKELESNNSYKVKVINIKQILNYNGICGALLGSVILIQHYKNEGSKLTTNAISRL